MRFLKIFLKSFIILFALLIAFLYIFDFDYLIKAVRTIYGKGHTTAFLSDYEEFDNRIIHKADTPQPWPLNKDYNTVEATPDLKTLDSLYGTVAFMIIENDSLFYENYAEGYSAESKSNSFSMAKTMVSAMLGKAIQEGYIKSLDQPVADFYPEFSEGIAGKMTVGNLSSMSSGLNWDESYYSPFSITTRAYFDDNLRKVILGLQVVDEPGEKFKYLSGNTQLLAMVLEKATGSTVSDYLSEKFWQPMGAEQDALWQLDSNKSGLEKAYCCIASNAHDFARFGKLYKDHGYWNGQKILDSAFVEKSIHPGFSESPEYGYGLWLLQHLNREFFMLRGHLGQYVIVQPEDNIIIVRLGHQTAPKDNDPFSSDIYDYIEEAYKMLGYAE